MPEPSPYTYSEWNCVKEERWGKENLIIQSARISTKDSYPKEI